MAASLDLTKIHWHGLGLADFRVHGQQAVRALLDRDPTASVVINHQARASYSLDDKRVVLELFIQMQPQAGEPARPLTVGGQFEFQFFYDVDNLAEFVQVMDGFPEPALQPALLLTLAGITYSTARGILWTRLAGTPLEGISLPIIDPRSLFDNPPPEPTAPPTSRKPPKAALKKPAAKS